MDTQRGIPTDVETRIALSRSHDTQLDATIRERRSWATPNRT